MKRIIYLVFLLGLLSACEKSPYDGSLSNSNYWYHQGWVTPGIKSIKDPYGAYKYDRIGRPTSVLRQSLYSHYGNDNYQKVFDQTKCYSYDSDGLPLQIQQVNNSPNNGTETITAQLEYNNKGKYCPTMIDLTGPSLGFGASLSEICWSGLLPNLSKITMTYTLGDEQESSLIVDYIFEGSSLLIRMTENSFLTNYKTETREIIVEYQGDYPYQGEDIWRGNRIGPVTYQDNGMFDTMEYGSGSHVTKYYYNHKLPKRDKVIYMNNDHTYSTEEYYYNDSGELAKQVNTDYNTDGTSYSATYEYAYEHDSRGNWIKQSYTITYAPGGEVETRTDERVIEYY